MLNLWVGLGWVGLFGWLVVFCCHFFVLFWKARPDSLNSLCEALRWAARLLTSTSSNTMSFVVAELMSLCDTAENGEAWRVALFFLISESRKSWQILGFLSLIPEGAPLNLMGFFKCNSLSKCSTSSVWDRTVLPYS